MIHDTRGEVIVSGKVVVVEVDELMLRVLVEVISDLGGQCESFVTADDALISLLQNTLSPSLLVTDYTLPGQLDGRELAMMANQKGPSLPILLTSGYGSEIAGELPGAIHFLRKPWSVDQFVSTVREIMDSSAARTDA